MALPAAEAVDQYLLPAGPTAANALHAAAVGEWTDGRTLYHSVDSAAHAVRAVQ